MKILFLSEASLSEVLEMHFSMDTVNSSSTIPASNFFVIRHKEFQLSTPPSGNSVICIPTTNLHESCSNLRSIVDVGLAD